MAKVYLDANKFFDLTTRKPIETSEMVAGHQVFVSPISYHIFSYTYKIQMPNQPLMNSLGTISAVSFDNEILKNSLNGPTNDFEDNVQLHSAAQENCDYFLTNDRKLLNMKFFGKTKIVDDLIK